MEVILRSASVLHVRDNWHAGVTGVEGFGAVWINLRHDVCALAAAGRARGTEVRRRARTAQEGDGMAEDRAARLRPGCRGRWRGLDGNGWAAFSVKARSALAGLFHAVRSTAIRWTVKRLHASHTTTAKHIPSAVVMHSADDNIYHARANHAHEPLMATSRDQPNPLRPYYIPPSIGLLNDPVPNAAPRVSPSAKPSASPPKPSFGSQARDILSDLDYGVDLSLGDGSPTVAEMAKKLLDQAVWNYTSVLFAQPFEVAKTVLQLHSPRSDQQSGLLDPEDAKRRAAAAARARLQEVS